MYRWVKTKTALVRTYCRVHLNAVTTVYMNFSVVVYPRHPKRNKSFWLYHSEKDILTVINFIFCDIRDYRFGNFLHRLYEFWFVTVTGPDLIHKLIYFCFHRTI